jgi:ABC-type antimicrobial peptide transport system permease subunit
MKQQHMIALIMLGVVAFSGFLSLGAWLSSHDWRRPAMVMGCVFFFLAFWGVMLARRRVS